jgi:hypothetical protein
MLTLMLATTLPACASLQSQVRPGAPTSPGLPPPPETIAAVVAAPPPSAAARTAAEFDTTTAAQKAAATSAPAGGRLLGETVASLGDPGQPGLWIRSPLVSAPGSGRLVYPATGRSAVVQLIPLDAPGGAGSQVSLAALRLLDAPLTALPVLQVYAD